jgi:hypothetical protein
MFPKKTLIHVRPLIEGVSMCPLSFGEKTILCEFKLDKKGYKIPTHSHPYEQTGYLISGMQNFRIAEE